MAGDFGQVGRSRSAGSQDVVRAVDEMRRTRNLEQTPSLVNTQVADDIRSVDAAVGVSRGTGGTDERGGNVTGDAGLDRKSVV